MSSPAFADLEKPRAQSDSQQRRDSCSTRRSISAKEFCW